jgi:hypothetical protein
VHHSFKLKLKFISLITDPVLRKNLINSISPLNVRPAQSPNEATIVVSGHNDETEHSWQDTICGRSVSAYPIRKSTRLILTLIKRCNFKTKRRRSYL